MNNLGAGALCTFGFCWFVATDDNDNEEGFTQFYLFIKEGFFQIRWSIFFHGCIISNLYVFKIHVYTFCELNISKK